MRSRLSRLVLLVVMLAPASIACSKSSDDGAGAGAKKTVEYGDAVGIEFGDATSGVFVAGVAAEKGHSPEKGVPSLAGALAQAAKACPMLAGEATDEARPPTLHLLTKGGNLEAGPASPTDRASVRCMTKAMIGKPSGLDPATPFELTIQLLVKPQKKKAAE